MAQITINNVIVHELQKKQHKSIEKIDTRNTVLDPQNAVVQKLLEGVTSVYGGRENGAHYGTFKTTIDKGPFPDAYQTYITGGSSTAPFVKLTHDTMGRLATLAEAVTASSGGFILFADYLLNSDRFFLVCMIKNAPGITIKNLEPEELERLELDKLSQAARVNVQKYSDFLTATEEERTKINYLSFISSATSKGTSGYFITALGCTKGSTSAQATRLVETESIKFFSERANLKVNTAKLRREIREYLKEKLVKEESATLLDIGEIARKQIPSDISDQADKIINEFTLHLNSEDIGVPTEFPIHKGTLKKSTHISGKTEIWSFDFDREALGTSDAADVFFNKNKKTVTLKNLPDDMIEEIEAQLRERNARQP